MSKTERILSFLPSTFQTEPSTNVYWLVDIFGDRLQEAESLLVSLMKAHWIDYADFGADAILDLARIAGLANLYVYYPNPACDPEPPILPVLRRKQEGGRVIPWEDYAAAGRKIVWERHEVERSRRYLKCFFLTYLEGPSTIRGLLRVAANTLDLDINDQSLERFTPFLTGAPMISGEAAPLLFGAEVWEKSQRPHSQGQDAAPASFTGARDLSGGVTLGTARYVKLSVDGAAPDIIDLKWVTSIQEVVHRLREGLGGKATVSDDGQYITVTGVKRGKEGSIKVLVPDEVNATAHIFGSSIPQTVHGHDAQAASLRGLCLDTHNDLSQERFLTIAVDSAWPRQVDCAGVYRGATRPEEIVRAINAVFSDLEKPLAELTMDGRLRLTSPTLGAMSRVELLPRYVRLQESPPVPHTWPTPESPNHVSHGGPLSIVNPSVVDEPITRITIRALRGITAPGLRDSRTGDCLRARVALAAGDVLHLWRDESGQWAGRVEGSVQPVDVNSSPSGRPRYLCRGASRWWFTECQGAKFDAAHFDQARFVGPPCRISGVFDATVFDGALPDEETVFATRDDPPPEPLADVSFAWEVHPAATIEIQLPLALPARYGARFDQARFVAEERFCEVSPVDSLEAQERLVAQLNSQSALVQASTMDPPQQPTLPYEEALFFEGGADASDGDSAQLASLVLYAEDWEDWKQAIKLEARRPGEWGNRLTFAAPAMLTRGTFNITIALAGPPAVFENARHKVWEAAREARAAGVQLLRVTRDHASASVK